MCSPQHFQVSQAGLGHIWGWKAWKVQLDVRDLGGHPDFIRRARAGTHSNRVRDATLGVVAVAALPLGFQVRLGLMRGKYVRADLHAAEASYVSASSLGSFRAAIVRSVWSCKMPLASTPDGWSCCG